MLNKLNTMKNIDTKEKESPRYEHDCNVCDYLGRYKEYDLYFCKSEPTVIARYGTQGDYKSGMVFANPDGSEPLYESKKRAIEHGLYTE